MRVGVGRMLGDRVGGGVESASLTVTREASVSKKNRFRIRSFISDGTGRLSTTWTFWADRTSFYLVNDATGNLKISLHGRDEKHGNTGRFHVRGTGGVETGQADFFIRGPREGWPLVFGREISPVPQHAVRVRITHAATLLGTLPAPKFYKSCSSGTLDPPSPGWALDYDIYFHQFPRGLHSPSPYARAISFAHGGSEALLSLGEPGPSAPGPGVRIQNDHGVYMTVSTRMRDTSLYRTPGGLLAPAEGPAGRYITFDVDQSGVLWVVEDGQAERDGSASVR